MNHLTLTYYTENAAILTTCWDRIDTEGVHGAWLPLVLPHLLPGSNVLDVGCGSGRDARWFAAQGHNVLGVEPCPALLAQAWASAAQVDSDLIYFITGQLPELTGIASGVFDLVLVSAVWQHVADEPGALRRLHEVCVPGGRVVITLRHGPPVTGRGDVVLDVPRLAKAAEAQGFEVQHVGASGVDQLQRSQISWSVLVLHKPG